MEKSVNLSETMILVDAEYLDEVVRGMRGVIEQQENRSTSAADLALWAECVALDGGVRGEDNDTQVVFIHEAQSKSMSHTSPSRFDTELSQQAFKGACGEFTFNSFPTPSYVDKEHFFLDSLVNMADAEQVKRILVVADVASYGDELAKVLADIKGKQVTLFSLQQLPESSLYAQDSIGYSVVKSILG